MKYRAFSLIESMVVIAIVGILAAVAVPNYKTYVVRTKISEAFNIARPCMIAFEEFVTVNGRYPGYGSDPNYYELWGTFGNDISKACFITPAVPSTVSRTLGYSSSSDPPIIEVFINTNVYTDASNNEYKFWLSMNDSVYRNSGRMQWYCRIPTYGFALPEAYLPRSLTPCQNQL